MLRSMLAASILLCAPWPAAAQTTDGGYADNEHYGNIVVYLRLKGLVPPSTARAQRPAK